MSEQHLETFFENATALVAWDTELACAFLRWHRNPSEGEYKVVLSAVLDLLAEKACAVVLSDARLLSLPRPMARDWLAAEWIPRAQAAGLRQMVMILPLDEWTKTVATTGVRAIYEMFNPQYFRDLDSARAWITEQA